MIVLGIESSCDETSVAVLRESGEFETEVLSNVISSQDFHKLFGGVVPELSSRAHIQQVLPLVKEALKKAGTTLEEVEVITATAGPGLIGALLVGFMFAKSLALATKKVFIPVNHIEGHIFSGFLGGEKPEFPMLVLVVSGGHSLLLLVKSFTEFARLGTTVDDAAGEAFDKVSKLIGLGYPGGPKIQRYAERGNPLAIPFPVSELKGRYDFSFSGLKTAVLRYVEKHYPERHIPEQDLPDIAASFQYAVIRALTRSVKQALKEYRVKSVSLVGGVAANKPLREAIAEIGNNQNVRVFIPGFEFCGDNAAMIAFRGYTLYKSGYGSDFEAETFPALPEAGWGEIVNGEQ